MFCYLILYFLLVLIYFISFKFILSPFFHPSLLLFFFISKISSFFTVSWWSVSNPHSSFFSFFVSFFFCFSSSFHTQQQWWTRAGSSPPCNTLSLLSGHPQFHNIYYVCSSQKRPPIREATMHWDLAGGRKKMGIKDKVKRKYWTDRDSLSSRTSFAYAQIFPGVILLARSQSSYWKTNMNRLHIATLGIIFIKKRDQTYSVI